MKGKGMRKGMGCSRRFVRLATDRETEKDEQSSKDELRLTNQKKRCVSSRQKFRETEQVYENEAFSKNNSYDYYPIHLETTELNSFREKLSRSTLAFHPDGHARSSIKLSSFSNPVAGSRLSVAAQCPRIPPYYSSIERTVITGARLCIVLRGKIFVNKCRGCTPCWDTSSERTGVSDSRIR